MCCVTDSSSVEREPDYCHPVFWGVGECQPNEVMDRHDARLGQPRDPTPEVMVRKMDGLRSAHQIPSKA